MDSSKNCAAPRRASVTDAHSPGATERAGQYVASKFTAAVLPPLMMTATRSPEAGL
jgi:hypothetical protein